MCCGSWGRKESDMTEQLKRAEDTSVVSDSLRALWSIACQTPLSLGFSRQNYWSRLLSPPPVDLPNPGTEPTSLRSPALVGRFFTPSSSSSWSFPSASSSSVVT